jgi:hypothetical protein
MQWTLDGVAGELAKEAAGHRNNARNEAAFKMGRMVARGWIGKSNLILVQNSQGSGCQRALPAKSW